MHACIVSHGFAAVSSCLFLRVIITRARSGVECPLEVSLRGTKTSLLFWQKAVAKSDRKVTKEKYRLHHHQRGSGRSRSRSLGRRASRCTTSALGFFSAREKNKSLPLSAPHASARVANTAKEHARASVVSSTRVSHAPEPEGVGDRSGSSLPAVSRNLSRSRCARHQAPSLPQLCVFFAKNTEQQRQKPASHHGCPRAHQEACRGGRR